MGIKRIKRVADDFFQIIDDLGNPISIGGKDEFKLVYSKTENLVTAGDPWNEVYSDELQEAVLEQDLLAQVLVQANWVENVGLAQWEYTLANAAIKATHNAIVQQTRASQQLEPVTFTTGGSTSAGNIIIAVAAEPVGNIDVDIFLKESEVLD